LIRWYQPGGFDPLLDESAEYAARLIRSGVPVNNQPEPSLVHGYIDLVAAVRAANRARDRIIRWTTSRSPTWSSRIRNDQEQDGRNGGIFLFYSTPPVYSTPQRHLGGATRISDHAKFRGL